jgi:hypothetical protein
MALPDTGPATLAGTCAELSAPVPGAGQRLDQLAAIVAAVNGMVRALPVALLADGEPTWDAAPQVVLGADRLAARLDKRRATPLGYEAFGEGGPVYVSRNDPDIAQLLQLGRYMPPMVG